tara:strand:- start:4502 stop:5266 length:765 start_codon:yes stop_codon:yes gene_type:complete
MKIKQIKVIVTSVMGLGLLSASQLASAGWDSGACPRPHQGPAPCIELQLRDDSWVHFNGNGGHAGDWHGYPASGSDPAQDFTFTGYTDLGCEVLGTPQSFNCELSLEGEVRKFQDDDDNWRIGVRVNSGTVAPGDEGDAECDDIEVGSFEWYAGNSDQHSPNASTGIIYTGSASSYSGNVGTLDVDYDFLFGIELVDQGHLHEVEYHNSDSTFRFGGTGRDNTIYENGAADDDSGCTVDGNLEVQLPAKDLNIL